MKHDWYSGSDDSGEIPKELDRYVQEGENWSDDQRLEHLDSILQKETDPNWRGHLFYLIGAEKLVNGDYDLAVTDFLQAEACFDPISFSFEHVSSSFCRNRFELVREKLVDDENDALILSYALSILCLRSKTTLTDYEDGLLLNTLGFALARLAQSTPLPLFDRLSLEIRQCAILNRENDPEDALENLFLSALALKDRRFCESILERLEAMNASDSLRNELTSLLKGHLGDSESWN